MEAYENFIYETLRKEISTPQSYKRAIKTALYKDKKEIKNNFKRVVLAACGEIILTTGIAFAGYTVYEKVWKEPRSYDVNQEKPAIISEEEKSELVTEDEIKEKAKEILKDFGYPNKEIKKIDLNRSYDDNLNSYYAVYTVEYPDFVTDEYTVAEVEEFAEDYNITLNIEYEDTTEYEPGTIIRQSRAAGSTVVSGARLTITVAREPVDSSEENPDDGGGLE